MQMKKLFLGLAIAFSALVVALPATSKVAVDLGNVTNGTQVVAGTKQFTGRCLFSSATGPAIKVGQSGYISAKSNSLVLAGGAYWNGSNYYTTGSRAAIVEVNDSDITFYANNGLTSNSTYTPTQVFKIDATGCVIGSGSIDGRLSVPAGSTAALTSPIKFRSGSLQTTPEALAFEVNGDDIYFSPSAGNREKIYTGSTATATLDPPSLSQGTGWESSDIAITSTASTDPIVVAPPASIEAGVIWCAFPSGTNLARVRVFNLSGSTLDIASGTWTIRSVK